MSEENSEAADKMCTCCEKEVGRREVKGRNFTHLFCDSCYVSMIEQASARCKGYTVDSFKRFEQAKGETIKELEAGVNRLEAELKQTLLIADAYKEALDSARARIGDEIINRRNMLRDQKQKFTGAVIFLTTAIGVLASIPYFFLIFQ